MILFRNSDIHILYLINYNSLVRHETFDEYYRLDYYYRLYKCSGRHYKIFQLRTFVSYVSLAY